MTPPPTVPEQWRPLGRTFNTRYSLLADDAMVILPDKGLKDAARRACQQGLPDRLRAAER